MYFNTYGDKRELHSFPTRRSSDLGVEGVGQNTKFFNTVRRGLHGRQIDELVVGISAVDTKVVRTAEMPTTDRKSTRLNSSHANLVCRLLLEKKNNREST